MSLIRKGLVDKLQIRDRRILRAVLQKGEYRRCQNSEIEMLTDCTRKRRGAFYDHVSRMSPDRLINPLIAF